MKNLIRLGLVALAGTVVVSSVASAANIRYDGTICQPYSPTDANNVGFTNWGVHNNSSSAVATVECLTPQSTTGGLNSWSVTTYDRDPGTGNSHQVCCTPYVVDFAGNEIWGGGQQCTTSYGPSAVTLSFTGPGSGTIGMGEMYCFLPTQTVNGVSHVATINVNAT